MAPPKPEIIPKKRSREDESSGGSSSGKVKKEFSPSEYENIQETLQKKLGPEYVSSRNNGTHNVAYLEGAKAISLANEVFGFNGWNMTVGEFTTDYLDVNEKTGRVNLGVSVIIRVSLKDGTYREDIGYGLMDNARSKGMAFEKCKKEAITDGLKRSLRQYGNVLGNCLYDNQFTRRVARMKPPEIPINESELYRSLEYRKAATAPPTNNVTIPSAKPTVVATNIKTEEEELRERERESLKNNLQSADFLGSDDMDDYEMYSNQKFEPNDEEGEEFEIDDDDEVVDNEANNVINPINEKNETELLKFVHGSQAPLLQDAKSDSLKFDPSYQTPDIKRTILHDKSVPIRRGDTPDNQAPTSSSSSPAPPQYKNPLARPPSSSASSSPMVGTPKVKFKHDSSNNAPLSDKGISSINMLTTPISNVKNNKNTNES